VQTEFENKRFSCNSIKIQWH